MDKITVSFNTKEDVSSSLMTEILNELAMRIESEVKEKFKNRAKGTWPARHVPNIAGILKDLGQSANVPARRFKADPTGVDTGALQNSIGTRVEGNLLYVEAINYAKSFTEGGQKRIVIEASARKNLTEWKKKNENYFEAFPQLGVIFQLVKKPFYEFMTPARPLLLKEDVQALAEKILTNLDLL